MRLTLKGCELFRAVRPDQEVDLHANRIGLVTDVERFQIEAAPFTLFIDVLPHGARHLKNVKRTDQKPGEACVFPVNPILSLRLERFKIVTTRRGMLRIPHHRPSPVHLQYQRLRTSVRARIAFITTM